MTDKEIRQARAQHAVELLDTAIHTNTLVSLEVTDRATSLPVTVLAEKWEDGKGNVALRPIAKLFLNDPNAELILPEGTISTFGRNGREALQNALSTPT